MLKVGLTGGLASGKTSWRGIGEHGLFSDPGPTNWATSPGARRRSYDAVVGEFAARF